VQLIRDILSGWTPITINIPTWLANVIDILVASFAIYKITQWIRATRAWSLFKGFIVVIAVYAVASIMGLVTILWVMRTTFNVGLIAVVVIFQPELRKALDQLGKGQYLGFFKNDDPATNLSAHYVNEILKAVRAMSEVNTGALIVIEQKTSIEDYIQTGIQLDALISNQLLINIFEHNTPLHDGAVIIRGNRIKAAGCILPLTTVEIGKELGTRHRAAVGMSEASDALILVVSEETGFVSIASSGNLDRDITDKHIRELLLMNDTDTKKRRPLILRRHKHAKKD
jgi:diadenylate cyclase